VVSPGDFGAVAGCETRAIELIGVVSDILADNLQTRGKVWIVAVRWGLKASLFK
jgi:hypothetical protein